jgi:hypothetical protein
MFEAIKKHWAEARADVVSTQVEDILQRCNRMHAPGRQLVLSAFDSVLSELEDQIGPVAAWTAEQKKQAAQHIMQSAQQALSVRGTFSQKQASSAPTEERSCRFT